eukprot:TRINITY_DN4599_c0_g1_i1.p1 TRINITY_DN4599_c0_g1~~TRINITY_DN4599_c0_g1_i1.p1  ORF type:complete len:349 (+),score=90.53 TRINITY_DN4599_c0_g1_i1:961-2007(+)
MLSAIAARATSHSLTRPIFRRYLNMFGIVVDEQSPDRTLSWAQVLDVAAPGPQQVVVDVYATAVNRADLLQRKGAYPPPQGASPILGLEMAGVVSAVGPSTTRFRVGDKVVGLLAGGGYAEKVLVHEDNLMAKPNSYSWEEAAAFPETFLTCYLNMFMEAKLQPGETFLVHGGASGIGTTAIQLAKANGSTVFVSAGSDEKLQKCQQLGANRGFNYKTSKLVETLPEKGVDVILDHTAASSFEANIRALNVYGRLVVIGTMGGSTATLNFRDLLMKQLRIIGSTLRGKPVQRKKQIIDRLMQQFGEQINAGTLKPVVYKTFAIQDANAAHQVVAKDENIGKVVLTIRT